MAEPSTATPAPAAPTDAVATDAGGAAAPSFDTSRIMKALGRSDIWLAIGVVMILVILILPMPTWLLDAGLAVSITFSVLILMTALFIEKPLEFNSFPTVLLLATMLRLSLNLASTRLILGQGHTGTDAAGKIIQAFGDFVMTGNFVIGIVVFAILIIVNFIVITKGASRIAEVAARFSLDAMPGKQMAIDADLSSGLITEDQARSRRKELEDESTFFGAMDGAAKFVRGDVIAGLLITFINVIGGMIIGVAQNDMTFFQAADTFTRLTVGDGLVTQIPALIVSTSAGLVVTKAGISGSTDQALIKQLASKPRALGMSSILLIFMGLLPGMPLLPFAFLGLGAGGIAIHLFRLGSKQREEDRVKEEADAAETPTAEEPISSALRIDHLRLELGYGLLTLINSPRDGQRLTEQIKALRRQLATDMGFVMPSVRIQDNMQLPANNYVIRVKEIEAGRGDLRPTMLLVIEGNNREEAMFRGYTVVDPATVITTHLTELIRDNMSELLTYAETQKLMDDLDKEHQKLITELIPNQISVGGVQRCLQNLLSERVSIRDLATILEAISEAGGHTRSIVMITEHIRARLARQISDMNLNDQGTIPLVTLSPQWEQSFAESLTGEGDERQLSMPPSKLQEFITALRNTFERQAMMGETPVLLTSPGIRPYVRSIVERFRPMTMVMSQNEVHAKARIKTVGQV
jgi:flagellar biosynthesis protein FlhA